MIIFEFIFLLNLQKIHKFRLKIFKMRAVIENIPDGDTFVHGDFHPKNIMVQKGEYLLIDMGDIGYGNTAFDLAVIKTCLDVSAKHMPYDVIMSAYGMTPKICADYYDAFCESYGRYEKDKLWNNAYALSKVRHTLWRAINNRG